MGQNLITMLLPDGALFTGTRSQIAWAVSDLSGEIGPRVGREIYLEDEQLVIAALAEIGILINDLNDLVRGTINYLPGVTLLALLLPQVRHEAAKGTIVHSFSRPLKEPEVVRALIDEFKSTPPDGAPPSYRWSVGSSLEMTRNLAFLTEIVSLAKDPQWADSREMLVLALGRSRAPAVINVLLELLDDPSPGIVCYAMKALKRNAMPVALPQIIAVGQRTTDPYVMEEAGKIWVASDRRRLRQEFDPVVMAKLSASQLK